MSEEENEYSLFLTVPLCRGHACCNDGKREAEDTKDYSKRRHRSSKMLRRGSFNFHICHVRVALFDAVPMIAFAVPLFGVIFIFVIVYHACMEKKKEKERETE